MIAFISVFGMLYFTKLYRRKPEISLSSLAVLSSSQSSRLQERDVVYELMQRLAVCFIYMIALHFLTSMTDQSSANAAGISIVTSFDEMSSFAANIAISRHIMPRR